MDGYTLDIKRSNCGPYYEAYVNGEFFGNFDTVTEAAGEFDLYLREQRVKETATA